jgi:hypothetical protein
MAILTRTQCRVSGCRAHRQRSDGPLDGAQDVPHLKVDGPFGESGTAHAGGLVGNRTKRLKVKRHGKLPGGGCLQFPSTLTPSPSDFVNSISLGLDPHSFSALVEKLHNQHDRHIKFALMLSHEVSMTNVMIRVVCTGPKVQQVRSIAFTRVQSRSMQSTFRKG